MPRFSACGRGKTKESASSRRRARWVALALLARAFPYRLAIVVGLALLNGALPAVFAVLVARLVESLPAAVDGGFGSPAGQEIVGILVGLGVVLAAQEIPAVAWVFWEDLLHHYDGYIRARIMRAMLSAPRLELFEDPDLAAQADRAVRLLGTYPGEVVPGFAEKWAAQAQGLAAAMLVATVSPAAAVGLAGLWLVVGRRLQADYAVRRQFWSDPARRARYLMQLGLMPAWAKELRVFGLVDWLGDRFGREWAVFMAGLWRAHRVGQRFMGPLFAVIVVANGLVLGWAVQSSLGGRLSIGAVAILVQGLIGMPRLATQDTDHLIESGSAPIPEVLELEKAVARLPSTSGTASASRLPAREICFDDVHFSYPGRDAAVFAGLDLRIEAGRSVGIVGLNGAGKTTLIKLLTGLEQPQRGRITVDGSDLAELEVASWRRTVAAIFQDFVRYELPARDNIGFGAVEALHDPDSDHILRTAAERAGADQLVADLPDGLATTLSRRYTGGVDLSGGQWQRIALARAMVAVQAGASVLVLDEPTAHLDVRAEADIYDRFLDLTRGLTTIVISHRFSTVRRADRIVVLDAGRVAEDGSHDQLLAADDQYARLFRKQSHRYTDTATLHGRSTDTAPGGDDA